MGCELGALLGVIEGEYDGADDGAPVTRNGSTSSNNVVIDPCISISISFAAVMCDEMIVLLPCILDRYSSAVLFRDGDGTRGMPSFCNVAGLIASIQSREDETLKY